MNIEKLLQDRDTIHNIHDNYFKFIFQKVENVRDFLEEFFPELSKHVQIESIEPQPTEKYSVQLKEKQYLDFAINCQIQNKPSQIYILFEHKSNLDKKVILQIAKYIVAVWEEDIINDRELRAVIPIVFYHGSKEWNIPRSTTEGFKDFPEEIKRYLLSLEYLIFDTSQVKDERINTLSSKNHILMMSIYILKKMSRYTKRGEAKRLFLELAEMM
ncbi:MAG: Rpn family recombination-promoting nuclease/putative transposase [Hydrogenothermaceae bacterium]|nr:Rpn family recombination-promoting nuclease/putative transposase [Hydrogenothermaceae bacterium]